VLAAPAAAQESLLARQDLQAVVELGFARDGAALAALLSAPDAAVRSRAAFALASVQDTAAVRALIGALADAAPSVRADAAFALGQTLLDPAAGEASRGAASDALLAALGRETDRAARARIYEALGKGGDEASLPRLAASGARPGDEAALAMAVARYGLRGVFHPAASALLAPLLAHDDAAVREAAAYPFGRWRDTTAWAAAAVPAVRAALDRAYAFQAGGRAAVAPQGPAPEIQLVAAVGRLANPDDTVRLVHWLEDAVDWRVRVSAARALAPRAEEESVASALLGALADPSTHVGVAAAAALASADSLPEEILHDVAVWTTTHRAEWRVSGEVLPVLARSGIDAFVILWLMWVEASDRENAPARSKALRALGHGSAAPGFRVLENLASDDDPRIAAAALGGLVERWRRGAVDETATEDRYWGAFTQALERGDVATVSEAAPVFSDSTFRPRGATQVLARAYRALEAPRDLEAMIAVVDALGETRDPAAAEVLGEALAHSDPVLRAAAARALTAVTGREVAAPAGAVTASSAVDWDALARLGPAPRLVLETARGRLVVELDSAEAPLTVQTIVNLARAGRYDGVPFHRVVPNFVVQAGDVSRGDGYGGPGFEILSEFTRIPYERGAIGMASAGKDTEGSQWFLIHSIQPHLDGRYTSFGRLVEGWDVLDAILEGDLVERATIE